jgi:hypothetical protein
MSETATIGATVTVAAREATRTRSTQLREEEPVSWVESVGLWLVTRWDDVHTSTRRPSLHRRDRAVDAAAHVRRQPARVRGRLPRPDQEHHLPVVPRRRDRPLPGRDDRADRRRADRRLPRARRGRSRVGVRRAAVGAGAAPRSGLAEVDDDTLRRWFVGLAKARRTSRATRRSRRSPTRPAPRSTRRSSRSSSGSSASRTTRCCRAWSTRDVDGEG